MSFYDALKDAINLAQKADNIDLYRKLLDISSQALDMQSEIANLRSENEQLRKAKAMEDSIEYHRTEQVDTLHREHPYITLSTDPEKIRYCAVCWGKDKKLIPLYDELNCLVCLERGRS